MPASGGGDPAEPLTYYIDPSVPAEWRGYMKTAVEAWRPAFHAAGLGEEAIRGGHMRSSRTLRTPWRPGAVGVVLMCWGYGGRSRWRVPDRKIADQEMCT